MTFYFNNKVDGVLKFNFREGTLKYAGIFYETSRRVGSMAIDL